MIKVFCLVIILCSLSACQTGKDRVENSNWFWSVSWHKNLELLAAGGNQGHLSIISNENTVKDSIYTIGGTITCLDWHPSKALLAVAIQGDSMRSGILDYAKQEYYSLDSIDATGARDIQWNSSGTLLAVGDYSGDIIVYNENASLLKKINTGQKAIISLDWHPAKNLILAVGEFISIYDLSSDSLRHTEDRDEDVLMLAAAWHPKGELFVTADYGDFEFNYPPLLQYWTFDGTRIKSIARSGTEYREVKWSPDGRWLATASDLIRIWDIKGRLVRVSGRQDRYWGIDWNAMSDSLVTSDEQGNISLWDLQLNEIIIQ